VNKVLIIGWRADDALVVDTLAKSLARDANIKIVSGSERGANEVLVRMSGRLRAGGLAGDFTTAKTGFSDFIFSAEWENFLKG
jgi:hypothetical protein